MSRASTHVHYLTEYKTPPFHFVLPSSLLRNQPLHKTPLRGRHFPYHYGVREGNLELPQPKLQLTVFPIHTFQSSSSALIMAALPSMVTVLSSIDSSYVVHRSIVRLPLGAMLVIWCPPATPFQRVYIWSLPNELLFLIVNFVFEGDETDPSFRSNTTPHFRSHKSTLNFSLVNKRMRDICIPRLFHDVHQHVNALGRLNPRLIALEKNPRLFDYIRSVYITLQPLLQHICPESLCILTKK